MGQGGIPQLKPKPRLLEQRARKAAQRDEDDTESEKARKRANGRCECFIIGQGRCQKRDTETHHLLGGWGRRARGESALAVRKQRLCRDHHRLVTAHVLRLLTEGEMPRWDHPYEQVW